MINTIAFAEIFNEADGLDFVGFYGEKTQPKAELNRWRSWHEDALEFVKARHPKIRFALDTYTPYVNPEHVPRNMQVWNFHSYYLWSVYDVLERAITWGAASDEPVAGKSVRRFLRRDLVPYHVVWNCRATRPPIIDDWYHRVWLYRNLDPNAMPELELLLRENLECNIDFFKQKATDAAEQAVILRDAHFPGIPLVLGEGASYCADSRLRWEERSDAYWEVIEHAARKRLPSNVDLRNLYAQLGHTLRSKCPGWKVVMLCDSIQLARATGLKFEETIPTLNGGLKVKVLLGHVD